MTILYYLTAGNGLDVTVETDAVLDAYDLAEAAAEQAGDDGNELASGYDSPDLWTLNGVESDGGPAGDDDDLLALTLGVDSVPYDVDLALTHDDVDALLRKVAPMQQAYEAMDDHDDVASILMAYHRNHGDFSGDVRDAYVGQHDSLVAYGRILVDDLYDVPDNIAPYFDYEKFGGDLEHDYYHDDETGHTFRSL